MDIKYLKYRNKINNFIYLKIILFLLLNFSVTTLATTEKNKIFELLEGRHWRLNSEKFLQLEEGTELILISIAEDTNIINYIRFRALEALSLFPTEKTAKFLEDISEKSFAALARRGFESFKRGFAKTHPKRIKQLASRLLNHPNTNLRISAARTIRKIDPNKFKIFIKSESNSWVREEAKK